jgi:hypothetical protein
LSTPADREIEISCTRVIMRCYIPLIVSWVTELVSLGILKIVRRDSEAPPSLLKPRMRPREACAPKLRCQVTERQIAELKAEPRVCDSDREADHGFVLINQNLDPRMLVAISELTLAELASCALWLELSDERRDAKPVFDPSDRHTSRELVQAVRQAASAANGTTVQRCKPPIRCEDASANGDDRGGQAEDRRSG